MKMSASSSATTDVTSISTKRTSKSSFSKPPPTQPARAQWDDDSWLAEIRTAMQDAGIEFCLHHYKEARQKYSNCVQMLLSSNKKSAPTSGRRQDQQSELCSKTGSDVISSTEATGKVVNTRQFDEVEDKFYHSLQWVSEKMLPPICGQLYNGMPRLCLFMPLLRYVCGVAYVKSAAALQDIETAMHYFNAMYSGDCHSPWFPLACYGLGNASLSQYRYKDARKHFERGLQALSAPASAFMASLCWPGTCTPVDEIRDAEKAFHEALNCTLFPAPPDGRCIYSLCLSNGNEQRAIYKSSIDYQGCTTLTCTDGCRMMYHSECWKSFTLQNWTKLTRKEMLGQKCITPDCQGLILSITNMLYKNGQQMLSEIFLPPAARRKMKISSSIHQIAPETGGSLTDRPQSRLHQISPALSSQAHDKKALSKVQVSNKPIHVTASPKVTKTPAQMTTLVVTETQAEMVPPGVTKTPAQVATSGATETPAETISPGVTKTPTQVVTLGATETPAEMVSQGITETPVATQEATEAQAETVPLGVTETPAQVATPEATETQAQTVPLGVTETPAQVATPEATETQTEVVLPMKIEAATNLLPHDVPEWQKTHAGSLIIQVGGEHKAAEPQTSYAEHDKTFKKSKCRGFDIFSPIDNSNFTRNDHQLRCSIQQAVIEGGSALVDQKYSAAEAQYEKCLTLLALLAPVPETIYDSVSNQETEIRLLYYAAGFACLQQKTKQGVMKGINHFGTVVNTSGTAWPIAYYGRGQGLMLLGSYHHAIADFTKGLEMLSSNLERTLYWPGTTVSIPESCDLKDRFEVALFASRYPPMPVARCVFERCPISNFLEREIYDCSCQYEGFVSIFCSKKCIINYHTNCWKDATLLHWGKPTDKGVPGQPCVTPNCNGKLTRVTVRKHIDGEDRTKQKIYHISTTAKNHERSTQSASTIYQPRIVAATSQPLAGYLSTSTTTQRKQNRDDSHGVLLESAAINESVALSAPVETEISPAARTKGETSLTEKVTTCSQASDPAFSVGDVPLLIIKKEPDRPEYDLKPEGKSSSKGRSATNGVLRPHIVARAFENSDEQTAPEELMSVWSYAVGADAHTAEHVMENASRLNASTVHFEATTAQEPREELCERIVRFFEEYLKENSPLDVQDIAITEFLVSKLPPQALDIVSACGGIGHFLTQYEQFSLIERYLCLRSSKLDSTVTAAKVSNTVVGAAQTIHDLLDGSHSFQQTFTNTPDLNSDEHGSPPNDVRNSQIKAQDIINSSAKTVTPASSVILNNTMPPSVTDSSEETQALATTMSENDSAANPTVLTKLYEISSDDRSGNDSCNNSLQSEVLMSLSARDDSVEVDMQISDFSEATLDQKIRHLDSKEQAIAMNEPCHALEDSHHSTRNPRSPGKCDQSWSAEMLQYQVAQYLARTEEHARDAAIQFKGLREGVHGMGVSLSVVLTEMKRIAERHSLLEQQKSHHSPMESQIQNLQYQVSQLTGALAEAKREAERDRAMLSTLGSYVMQLLRVNISHQEKDLEQRIFTSDQLKEIESGVAKVFSKAPLSQDDGHAALPSSVTCKD